MPAADRIPPTPARETAAEPPPSLVPQPALAPVPAQAEDVAPAPWSQTLVRAAKAGFVVVVDPGHGGADTGTRSAQQVLEKDVVLAVAQDLAAALRARHRYDVRMTRSTDTFVSLDQRVAISNAAQADLFISLHADSAGDPALAASVRGATVYVLSDQASSQAAQELADQENAAGAVLSASGLPVPGAEQLYAVLASLTQRETTMFSAEFRQLVLQRLRAVGVLGHDPARSAGFKVLRQAKTPTVLIELGFLSHPDDAALLQSTSWRKAIAERIASAVDGYAGHHLAAIP